MVLHNRLSATELKARLAAETFRRVTVSFYQYAKIADPQLFRDELYQALFQLQVFGRIYVAHEGINAQASIPEHHFEAFKQHLYSIPFLNGVRLNIAVDDNGKSFWVLRIKVREKIVADGITDPSFDMDNRGRYVNAREFNKLAEDPDTVIIDMRNHYEFEVGHFERAQEVPSDTFREQLPMAAEMMEPYKDKNIIMYCTGGIRCEKASAYMLHRGFRNVFHLEGGIIGYANKAKEWGLPNKFRGKNFVFDERLGERISEDIISQCHQCGEPCDTHTNCANEGCHLLFIQCEKCAAKYNGCCSEACTDILALPEEEQAQLRKGVDKGLMLFNKSRRRLKG
ncbi:rhodanese-related sulfurtransferase [Chitinophaga sp. XS-30]|uniref:oxygen-dependent tRNA uridine(34) hydroxylase TrhO n=1 Tax=Chitinophaga sp. XS-30 TaxID=2604421 RepID=UPI0011DC81FF|nr:rhodanese-related sulfurtransferase [Chitinophaga sp. XS-30]QEH42566.1 rhodanese-related sulfurtransferase [Chitinophaga sp. XS-30]